MHWISVIIVLSIAFAVQLIIAVIPFVSSIFGGAEGKFEKLVGSTFTRRADIQTISNWMDKGLPISQAKTDSTKIPLLCLNKHSKIFDVVKLNSIKPKILDTSSPATPTSIRII